MPRDTWTAPATLPLLSTSGAARTSATSVLPWPIISRAPAAEIFGTAAFAASSICFTLDDMCGTPSTKLARDLHPGPTLGQWRMRVPGPRRCSQSLDQPGIDQEPVEALCLSAVVAGIEHALAPQHDPLLLLEGGIERNAGGFLDHQRQIGAIDRVHHGRTLHRLEIDRVDR